MSSGGMEEAVAKRAERYIALTRQALKVVEVVPPPGSELRRVAERLIDMARRYLSDAEYYLSRDPAVALSAASYAHAWLDVGVVLGLLKGEDPKLFMVEP